jgi:hypothetical protein
MAAVPFPLGSSATCFSQQQLTTTEPQRLPNCWSMEERVCISGFEGSQAVPARPSGKASAYDRN